MRVLGLNGWHFDFHDASAALVEDGRVVAFSEEERFTRERHGYNTAAHQSAAYCLASGGLELDDIDVVAFGWNLPVLLQRLKRGRSYSHDEIVEHLLPRDLFPRSREPRVEFLNHHLSHAASSFYLSGMSEAAILVVDGQGEAESLSVFKGSGQEMKLLETLPGAWSLGYFYEAVAEYCGLGEANCGKLMGLAGHGRPVFGDLGISTDGDKRVAVRHIRPGAVDDQHWDESRLIHSLWMNHLASTVHLPPNVRRRHYKPSAAKVSYAPSHSPFAYRDLAATAQETLGAAVVATAERALELTGSSNLCIAGGSALNTPINGALEAMPGVDKFYVSPVPYDAGVSLGAALYISAQCGTKPISPLGDNVGLGPSFGSDEIAAELAVWGHTPRQIPDALKAVASRISSGQVVAWFQGGAEMGPRALGRRSIIASSSSVLMREHINTRVKHREWWRPLAPSMLAEELAFLTQSESDYPYMISSTDLGEAFNERHPSVVHVDGSTRPQGVDADSSCPEYRALLEQTRDLTGEGVILNTSFNLNGEPIVTSPRDAMNAFHQLNLDAMLIGPYLVTKD